jgi:hypothetical protein
LFKEFNKVRIVFKTQPISNFFETHICLSQKAFGLKNQGFFDAFFGRFSSDSFDGFAQMIGSQI